MKQSSDGKSWMPRIAQLCATGLGLAFVALIAGCPDAPSSESPPANEAPTDQQPAEQPPSEQSCYLYTYHIVNTYPHDTEAFTEGLVFENGCLYEGTGLNGQSELRKAALETGEVLQRTSLDPKYFGEGVTIWCDNIIELTWQTHVGFVYKKDTFELLQDFQYPTEGWGLTHDCTRLIMSDGTSYLHFLDPQTFEETSRLQVLDNGQPVTRLNELEYVEGEIFANVWQTDKIARIAPDTGEVTGWIDLTGLLSEEDCTQRVDVLNGIAYDEQNKRLFVTGKWWPKLFEIELVCQESQASP